MAYAHWISNIDQVTCNFLLLIVLQGVPVSPEGWVDLLVGGEDDWLITGHSRGWCHCCRVAWWRWGGWGGSWDGGCFGHSIAIRSIAVAGWSWWRCHRWWSSWDGSCLSHSIAIWGSVRWRWRGWRWCRWHRSGQRVAIAVRGWQGWGQDSVCLLGSHNLFHHVMDVDQKLLHLLICDTLLLAPSTLDTMVRRGK